MPRDIPIGNGNLLITFDQDYCLRDIYYPHAGKENHTDGHKFRLGIWVDGVFDWVSRGKSTSPKQKSGCNCGLCDIWNKYELSDFYYCIEGEAK